MKVAIMQPYFLPYIGYFQLINAVDKFVIYDNIKFTKKGWINRNRILFNTKHINLTIPLKKDSDHLFVCQRILADSFYKEKIKTLNKINASYARAPFFKDVEPLLIEIFDYSNINLFEYILNSLKVILEYLAIETEILISSNIKIDHTLKSEDKVIAINKVLYADEYINPIGGLDLYCKNQFRDNRINLSFIKSNEIKYKQFNNDFVPFLSILDIMMFNSKEEIKEMLNQFTLI